MVLSNGSEERISKKDKSSVKCYPVRRSETAPTSVTKHRKKWVAVTSDDGIIGEDFAFAQIEVPVWNRSEGVGKS